MAWVASTASRFPTTTAAASIRGAAGRPSSFRPGADYLTKALTWPLLFQICDIAADDDPDTAAALNKTCKTIRDVLAELGPGRFHEILFEGSSPSENMVNTILVVGIKAPVLMVGDRAPSSLTLNSALEDGPRKVLDLALPREELCMADVEDVVHLKKISGLYRTDRPPSEHQERRAFAIYHAMLLYSRPSVREKLLAKWRAGTRSDRLERFHRWLQDMPVNPDRRGPGTFVTLMQWDFFTVNNWCYILCHDPAFGERHRIMVDYGYRLRWNVRNILL